MTPLLEDRDDRGVVTLTLNRPQAFNALSEAMLTALGDAFDEILLPCRETGTALFARTLGHAAQLAERLRGLALVDFALGHGRQ